MRVCILSDTHRFLDPRVAAAANGADLIIHAGDLFEAEVLRQLDQRGRRVIAVAGNNDRPDVWSDDEHDWLETLPQAAAIPLPGGLLCVEHGHRFGNHPPHHRLRESYRDARLIVYGHTHIQVLDTEQTPWVLNPGAAGNTRTHGGPSCAILRIDAEKNWDIELLKFSYVTPAALASSS